jgi:hypothetical protein
VYDTAECTTPKASRYAIFLGQRMDGATMRSSPVDGLGTHVVAPSSSEKSLDNGLKNNFTPHTFSV